MFYFAWVEPEETTFGPEHERVDEDIFAFELSHSEGEAPALLIDIRNPRIGLLNPGRKVWAWLAYNDTESTGGSVPLFFGRLIGVPEDLQDEVVRLEFLARPLDFDAQKSAHAETLKVTPYWDPIWLREEERSDPDSVLEARASRWHTDRVTHVVSASDMLSGEDGTINLGGDFFRDSLRQAYGPPPARKVHCVADVYWDQKAAGSVDLVPALLEAAAESGSVKSGLIETYTGDGLARDWPTSGARIGGGWTVGASHVLRGEGIWLPEEFESIITFDLFRVDFPLWSFLPVLDVDYEVSRSRQEHLVFEIEADCQALLTDAGEAEVISVAHSSRFISDLIDPPFDSAGNGDMPIGDVRRRAYFPTERGKESLGWLIAFSVARLLERARAVEVSFQTTFQNGLDLSCRKNVFVEDARLPGGQAAGKVLGYTLSADGDSGELVCGVTIGCTIGQGGTVVEVEGDPTWVEAGWVEAGWQQTTGAIIMPIPGVITYEADDLLVEPDDDGVDFFNLTPTNILRGEDSGFDGMEMVNGRDVQEDIINSFTEGFWSDVRGAIAALNEVYSQFHFCLVPLTGGPFVTNYEITMSDLVVPKTIDLEADSS